MISYSRFLAGTVCALVLAGCDSIKDVPEEPYGNLPQRLRVVGGTVTGLGSLRAIELRLNGNATVLDSTQRNTNPLYEKAAKFITAPVPTIPSDTPPVTTFTFGSLAEGASYRVEVALQPFGKNCTATVNGAEVSVVEGTVGAQDVDINFICVSTVPRFDVTVRLPANPALFIDAPEAKVRLNTEEQVYELDLEAIKQDTSHPQHASLMNATNPTVTFEDVLVDSSSHPVSFPWLVTATTKEGGRVNKCTVTGASNTVLGTGTNLSVAIPNPPTPPAATITAGNSFPGTFHPTGHVTAVNGPIVGTVVTQANSPCRYTIGGRIGYSHPAGTTFTSKTISGLKLELRNAQGTPVGNLGLPFDYSQPEDPLNPWQYLVNNCTTANAVTTATTVGASATTVTATNFGCLYTFPYELRSSSDAVYDVAVAEHPAGMRCVVSKGGAATLFVPSPTNAASVLSNPGSVTNTNVICRDIPTDPARLLSGVYRLKSQAYAATTSSTPATVSWRPFNLAVQNHATSGMLTFFDDGTFLYGSHNIDAGTQVEHGFYDYDPNANTGVTFRAGNQAVGDRAFVLTGNYSADADASNVAAAIAAQLTTLPGVTVGFSGTNVTFTANAAGTAGNALVQVRGASGYGGSQTTTVAAADPSVSAVYTMGPMNLDFSRAGRLSFSPVVDTNNSVTFPTFNNTDNFGVDQSTSGTPGISASPGPVRQAVAQGTSTATSTYVSDPTMLEVMVDTVGLRLDEVDNEGNVVIPEGVPPLNTVVRRIRGKWGAAGTLPIPSSGTAIIPTAVTAARLDWVLEEPPSVDQEMTGTWITQDHRRMWAWDFRTYYGFAVNMLGGAISLNDACFTMEDLRQSSGIYTRRGTVTNCYPFNRPANGAFYTAGGKEAAQSIVFPPGTGALISIVGTTPLRRIPVELPGFVGYIPGGASAADGRSPSPVQFHIAEPGSFFGTGVGRANPKYFPENFPTPTSPATDLSWCNTEILGIRSTSNGNAIDYPIYFCRANN